MPRRPRLGPRGSPLDKLIARRLFFNLLPFGLVVGALWFALAGDEGLLKRHAVKQRLLATEQRVAEQERENAELAARIRGMRRDPAALRRVAAEHLLMAESGSTIYRFVEDPNTPPPVAAVPAAVPAEGAAPSPQAQGAVTGAP